MANDRLSDARALIRAGRTQAAQKILEPLIEADPRNIQAWLLEAATWPTRNGRCQVLELCLEHNPNSIEVLRALATLDLPSTHAANSLTAHLPTPRTSLITRVIGAGGLLLLSAGLIIAWLWLRPTAGIDNPLWWAAPGAVGVVLLILTAVVLKQGGWRMDPGSSLGLLVGAGGIGLMIAGVILTCIWALTPRNIMGDNYRPLWVISLGLGSVVLLALGLTWRREARQPLLRSLEVTVVSIVTLACLLDLITSTFNLSAMRLSLDGAIAGLCLLVAGRRGLPRWLRRALLVLTVMLAVLFVGLLLFPDTLNFKLRLERVLWLSVLVLAYWGGVLQWRGVWPRANASGSGWRGLLVNGLFVLAGLGSWGAALYVGSYWYANLSPRPLLVDWDHSPGALVIEASDRRQARQTRLWGDGYIVWVNSGDVKEGHLSEPQVRDLLNLVDFPAVEGSADSSPREITVVEAGWRRTHPVGLDNSTTDSATRALLESLFNGAGAAGGPYTSDARFVRAMLARNRFGNASQSCVPWLADKAGFTLRTALNARWMSGSAAEWALAAVRALPDGQGCFREGPDLFTLDVFPLAIALKPIIPPTLAPTRISAAPIATPFPMPAPSVQPATPTTTVLAATDTPTDPTSPTPTAGVLAAQVVEPSPTPTQIVGDLGWIVISGTVTTADGAPLAGATVTCQQASYILRAPCFGTQRANRRGQFSFGPVFLHDTDSLTLEVAAPGYRPQIIRRPALDVIAAPRFDFVLQLP